MGARPGDSTTAPRRPKPTPGRPPARAQCQDVTEPWLSGLLACSLSIDADAVRAALHARGLKTRSVPGGRAKGAWTCVTDRGTFAVVVSGRGAEAARQAASFWMPRARWLVLATAGPGTGMAQPGRVVLDGDAELQTLAARGAPAGTTTERARVATVTEAVIGQAARHTLQEAGYAAWDPTADTWRQAATAVGGVMLICHAILPEASNRTLAQDVSDGATGRPWWRQVLAAMSPAIRRRQQEADQVHRRAIDSAAACAVAALLGTP
jgi:hypothetical protein